MLKIYIKKFIFNIFNEDNKLYSKNKQVEMKKISLMYPFKNRYWLYGQHRSGTLKGGLNHIIIKTLKKVDEAELFLGPKRHINNKKIIYQNLINYNIKWYR